MTGCPHDHREKLVCVGGVSHTILRLVFSSHHGFHTICKDVTESLVVLEETCNTKDTKGFISPFTTLARTMQFTDIFILTVGSLSINAGVISIIVHKRRSFNCTRCHLTVADCLLDKIHQAIIIGAVVFCKLLAKQVNLLFLFRDGLLQPFCLFVAFP